eukprot:scaffold703_cov168-Amphora_coffeaeformis.AAC.11
MPEEFAIEQAGVSDVLLGRGSGPNGHPGNVIFRKMVEDRKAEYLAAKRRQTKNDIATALVAEIRKSGGRFLKKKSEKEPNVWVLADEEEVSEKVKQALRQKTKEQKVESAKERDSDSSDDKKKKATTGPTATARPKKKPRSSKEKPTDDDDDDDDDDADEASGDDADKSEKFDDYVGLPPKRLVKILKQKDATISELREELKKKDGTIKELLNEKEQGIREIIQTEAAKKEATEV